MIPLTIDNCYVGQRVCIDSIHSTYGRTGIVIDTVVPGYSFYVCKLLLEDGRELAFDYRTLSLDEEWEEERRKAKATEEYLASFSEHKNTYGRRLQLE